MVNYDTGEPFVDKTRVIIVLVGIDGTTPPQDLIRNIQNEIEFQVNEALDFDVNRASVHLTIGDPATKSQKEELGSRTLYVMQFDVDIGDHDINQRTVNGTHNHVVDYLNSHGFNITGTDTMVINKHWE